MGNFSHICKITFASDHIHFSVCFIARNHKAISTIYVPLNRTSERSNQALVFDTIHYLGNIHE